MTLDDYALYLARRLTSPNTVKLRRNYIAKLEAFADRDATRATENDLYEFLEAHPHWSTAPKRTVVCAFRDYYRWAVKSGLVDVDPSEDMVTPRVHRLPSRIASEECIRKGLENGTTEDKAMLLLAAECGLRLAEIASLHRTCRHDDFLRIIGKGNRQRYVHASPELLALLVEIEQTSMRHGNYFPGQSGKRPMHSSSVWRHLTDLVGTNPHSLRHRAGTAVYRGSGHDLRLTQEFLGHSSPNITAIYVHIERDDLRRASSASRVFQSSATAQLDPRSPLTRTHTGPPW